MLPPLGSSLLPRRARGRCTLFGGRSPSSASLVWGRRGTSSLRIRPPLPTFPTEEGRVLALEWAHAPGWFLARFWVAGSVRYLGRWSCRLPGTCAWPGRCWDWEVEEEGLAVWRGYHGDPRPQRSAAWGDGRGVEERAQGTYSAIKEIKVEFLFFKLVLRPNTTSGAAIPPPLPLGWGWGSASKVKNKHTWKRIVHVDDHLPTQLLLVRMFSKPLVRHWFSGLYEDTISHRSRFSFLSLPCQLQLQKGLAQDRAKEGDQVHCLRLN